jgi:RNA polymerase sigma-70 factor (ECF subfamily)
MAVKSPPVRAPESDDDGPLFVRLAAGDLGALGEIYDRHRAAVRAFVLRATGDRDDADDVLQNTFLTAARIADRYDGRASCRPWLIGIAARLVQQRVQTFARVGRYLARFAGTQRGARDPRPALEARSSLDAVGVALARMNAAKRVVLLMIEVEGMSGPEVAEALAIPIGTVWTRLHHARRELAAALEVTP